MMYLFLKAEPSPEAPYQLLFITVTKSRGGWVTLYGSDKGQALVLEQNEFPTLEAPSSGETRYERNCKRIGGDRITQPSRD